MRRLLKRIFLRGRDETTVPREAYGAFAGAVGIGCNLLLCLFKIAAGWLSGSIALVADGVNNLSDAASSVVTLVGFKMAQKPADKEHPYGHARMEYMAGMFVAIGIIIVGFELLHNSIQRILAPAPVTFGWLPFAVLAVSVVLKWWMRSFYRSVSGEIHSPALTVAADDSRNDAIATAAVLAGTLIQYFTGWTLDGWLGCAVALFILISGIVSVGETMSPLLGEAPDPALVQNIVDIILAHDGVLGVHDLLVHGYGPGRQFATVHVEMDASANALISHGVIDNIERQVERETGVRLVIHYDPIAPHDAETEKLARQVADIVAGIDDTLSIHDLRLSHTHDHTNVIFDIGAPPGYAGDTSELRRRIADAVRALGGQYYPVIEIDRNYLPPQGE